MASKALLIGINRYPSCALNGCVNDIEDTKAFLLRHGYFTEDQILILLDDEASTGGCLRALNWLITDVQAGDKVYFHYSGHGSQVPDASEADGKAECICPYDFDFKPEHLITDKQFVAYFSQLPAGVKFNWVSDSCHSGDLDRDFLFNPQTPRSFPIPDGFIPLPPKRHPRELINGVLDVGFISGCKSFQTSADAFINGRYNGALTYNLLTVLEKEKNSPLDYVVDLVRVALDAQGYSQQPQCEGSRSKLPFLA